MHILSHACRTGGICSPADPPAPTHGVRCASHTEPVESAHPRRRTRAHCVRCAMSWAQATAIGVRVDVSRLLHSAATTLELLRDVKRGYCGGGAVTQELLLRRRPGATPADRARAITDSPRRRPPLPAAPAAARDDAIAGGHGGYHTPNRGGGRGLTGLPGSPPTELGSPQPQKVSPMAPSHRHDVTHSRQ